MKKIFFNGLIVLFLIGCGSGSSGGNNENNNSSNDNGGNNDNIKTEYVKGNVALGPIASAKVDIYLTNGTKIYSTTTNKFNTNDERNGSLVSYSKEIVGKFKVDKSIIKKYQNKMLKLVVSGGKDIDADDNGKVDDNFTDIKGNLYAYVYGKDFLDKNVTVNEFTTLAAIQIMKDNIKTDNRILAYLKNFRKKIMKNDLALYEFNPANLDENGTIIDLNKLQHPNIFDDILNSNDFQNYIKYNQNIVKDSDGDGLFDLFEKMIGSDENKIDSDDDSVNDYTEIYSGTNPIINDINESKDILFKYQWHLKNTGQNAGAQNSGIAGYDINVTSVWQNYGGNRKIKIGVVDTGIELKHPDLNTQIDLKDSYRYSDGSNNPSPDYKQLQNEPYVSAHGTAVSGIIAAKCWNKKGVCGIATSSTLIGLNVFSDPRDSNFYNALSKNVDISSNSWGVSSGTIFEDSTLDDIIKNYSENRTIFVFAAGNDRDEYKEINNIKYYFGNANNSCLLNNKYTIVVAAMDANGTYSSYSNFGDDILISAPGGEFGYNYPAIVTTDLTGLDYGFDSEGFANDYRNGKRFDVEGNEDGNYTNYMNGTSAATPMVSGIIALMLNANPNLTYREVKYILAKTARKIDENDSNWSQNAAGIWFNPNYGFGLVNAGKAVEMAKDFSLPSEKETQLYNIDTNVPIPDNNTTGISLNIDVDENISIEYVNVWVSIPDHTFPGDLEIDLISPNGTISKLSYGGKYYVDGTIENKRYGSNKFLDEYSKGTWKLVVKDLNSGDTGTLKNVKLQIFGH